MKKSILLLLLPIVFMFASCSKEDLNNVIPSDITAKEYIDEVLTLARTDFAPDAKLAGIYGWNVAANGTIDLLAPTENIFVYIVQSSSLGTNEFYVPVFGAGPIRSPINFETIIAAVGDEAAKTVLETAFQFLATGSISSAAVYPDSPLMLAEVLADPLASSFRTAHPDTKFDIILVPSKAIDITGITDSADWIINFKSSGGSLVLWYNSQLGTVTKISG